MAKNTISIEISEELIAEVRTLRAENERLTATIEAATGECIVDLPAPDTDNARLLLANKAMARENERLRAALREIIKSSDNWRDCQAALAYIQDTAKDALGDDHDTK